MQWIGGAMVNTLVVALDLEDDGDRALPTVRALAKAGRVRCRLGDRLRARHVDGG